MIMNWMRVMILHLHDNLPHKSDLNHFKITPKHAISPIYQMPKQEKELTATQWKSLSVMPPPTASKVAIRGTKNPYPIPPSKLPITPTIGQRMSGKGKKTSTTDLRTRPNLLVLKLNITKTKSPMVTESKSANSRQSIIATKSTMYLVNYT